MKIANYSEAFGHWLSGFCDGESYFQATLNVGKRQTSLNLVFGINLRYDDHSILEVISSELGVGTIRRVEEMPCRGNSKPMAAWSVRRMGELSEIIIPHFDNFPLRTRKKQVYDLWRELVKIKVEISPGVSGGLWGQGSYLTKSTRYEEILNLVRQIKAVRSYDDTAPAS